MIREKKMTKNGLTLFKQADLRAQTAPTVAAARKKLKPSSDIR